MKGRAFRQRVRDSLSALDAGGLMKPERVILSAQGAEIVARGPGGTAASMLNFCANDYLGLAAHEAVVEAAREAADRWGAGLASVRFICGTQAIHKALEAAIADYLGFEDAMLLAACFDANGALFEPLFGAEDAIVSDTLNHASIIDGIRLSRARRYRFAASDMEDLERQLRQARADGARTLVVATDGVFSMDGQVARLEGICELAERYDALVMVDDCHATGHLGAGGRGSAELCEVEGRIDIVTGTFGKTLSGSMGGFICASGDIIALLRQRARPYLFSNSLVPAACGAALEAIRIARSEEGAALRRSLGRNCRTFRERMKAAGFVLGGAATPIMPVMVGDARRAQDMAARLVAAGIYVTGFSYPVVPEGQARLRLQLTARHTDAQIEAAVEAFAAVRAQMEGVAA